MSRGAQKSTARFWTALDTGQDGCSWGWVAVRCRVQTAAIGSLSGGIRTYPLFSSRGKQVKIADDCDASMVSREVIVCREKEIQNARKEKCWEMMFVRQCSADAHAHGNAAAAGPGAGGACSRSSFAL